MSWRGTAEPPGYGKRIQLAVCSTATWSVRQAACVAGEELSYAPAAHQIHEGLGDDWRYSLLVLCSGLTTPTSALLIDVYFEAVLIFGGHSGKLQHKWPCACNSCSSICQMPARHRNADKVLGRNFQMCCSEQVVESHGDFCSPSVTMTA